MYLPTPQPFLHPAPCPSPPPEFPIGPQTSSELSARTEKQPHSPQSLHTPNTECIHRDVLGVRPLTEVSRVNTTVVQ